MARSSIRSARGIVALVISSTLASGCKSSEPLFTIEGGIFTPKMDGEIGLSSSSSNDVDTIDLQSDLDIGEQEVVPYLRAEMNFARINLAVSGFKTSQSGEGTATADFGDITAGSTVDSSLDLGLLHGRLAFDFLDFQWVTVGAGIGADYFDVQLDVDEQVFGLNESLSVREAVPLLLARVVVRPPSIPLDFSIEAGGITGTYSEVEGTILDLEALVRWRIHGPFALFGGYRFVSFKLSGSSDSRRFDGDVTVSGFLLGASLRF